MKTKYKKKLISAILSVVVILVIIVLDRLNIIEVVNEDAYQQIQDIDDNLYEIIRVVDGDTIVINYNGKEEKVRLIGDDTPESVHPDKDKNTSYGKIASEYTKKMLEGKKVSLELDVQERDKYGRILAYVYVDGKMYNETLLENGYAKVATYPPNVKYVDIFKKLEKKAREENAGLWEYEED